MQTVPQVSVIIPTYRDWSGLAQCLAALRQQTLPAECFEIVVVNDDAAAAPADFDLHGATLLHEPRGYSYAARNAGLAVARAPLLAFTDADCIPEPQWLRAGLAVCAADASVALAAGQVRVLTPARRSLATDAEQVLAFRQQDHVRDGRAVTANLFVRRSVFDQIGPFDASLQSMGDFDFTGRATAAGLKLVYAADAVVAHPARATLGALLRKNRRVAGGYRQREFDHAGLHGLSRWRAIARLARPRPRYWWRLLCGLEKTGSLPRWRRPGVMAVQMLLHYHFALSVLRRPPAKHAH